MVYFDTTAIPKSYQNNTRVIAVASLSHSHKEVHDSHLLEIRRSWEGNTAFIVNPALPTPGSVLTNPMQQTFWIDQLERPHSITSLHNAGLTCSVNRILDMISETLKSRPEKEK